MRQTVRAATPSIDGRHRGYLVDYRRGHYELDVGFIGTLGGDVRMSSSSADFAAANMKPGAAFNQAAQSR
jgi:hypothetical protein